LHSLPDTDAVDRTRNLHLVAICACESNVAELFVRKDNAGYVQFCALVALPRMVTNGMLDIC
jgi:hypothetical protein